MPRLLCAVLTVSLLGTSAALAQSDRPPVGNSIDRDRPESSAQNSPDQNFPAQDFDHLPPNQSDGDGRSNRAGEGSPKADIIYPAVTTRNILPLPRGNETKITGGERELTAGLLSKDASFRLIVSGPVGVAEINRLIAKLELDKQILATADGDVAK